MTEEICIVGKITLCSYDRDMPRLYQKLLSLRKDVYLPNEKIIIEHHEGDYYYYDHLLGFTMHNLMTMITRLGISLSVFIFITSHRRLEEALSIFVVDPNDRPTVLYPLVMRQFIPLFNFDPSPCIGENKDIKYHSMCALGRPRNHKQLLAKYLLSHGMTDRISLNYNSIEWGDSFGGSSPNIDNDHLDQFGLVYSSIDRMNETWSVPARHPLISTLDSVHLPDKIVCDEIPVLVVNDIHNGVRTAASHMHYKHFAMNIVCESGIDNLHTWPISEKTLRSIWHETPFIVLGASGILKRLREYGFETFDDHWDESYDGIIDAQDRFVAFCQTLQSIHAIPLDKMKKLYQELRPRLERNRLRLQHYLDNDCKQMYNRYGIDHATDNPFNS